MQSRSHPAQLSEYGFPIVTIMQDHVSCLSSSYRRSLLHISPAASSPIMTTTKSLSILRIFHTPRHPTLNNYDPKNTHHLTTIMQPLHPIFIANRLKLAFTLIWPFRKPELRTSEKSNLEASFVELLMGEDFSQILFEITRYVRWSARLLECLFVRMFADVALYG